MIKTSEAVTGLKAAFSNIIKPSTEATKAAESLGLQFDASTVKSKGWQGFLVDVKNKLKEVAPEYAKATEEQAKLGAELAKMEKSGNKNADAIKKLKQEYKDAKDKTDALKTASSSQLSAFGTMFGSVEGLNTVLTLTSDQGMSLYNESMKQMGGTTDLVNQAFDKMNSTSGAKMKQLSQEFKNTLADVGVQLMPTVNKVLKALADMLNAFNKMSPAGKEVVMTLLAIVATVGPVLVVFGSLFKAITNISTGFKTVKELAGAFKLGKAAEEGAKVTGVFTKLKGALNLTSIVGFVTSPTGLIIAAIGGIAIAGYELIKHWDGIKKKAKEVWDKVRGDTTQNTQLMKNTSSGHAQELSTNTQKHWSDIWKATKEKWEAIRKDATTNSESLYTTSGGHALGLSTDTQKHWSDIWKATKEKWEAIRKDATTNSESMHTTSGGHVKSLSADISKSWNETYTNTRESWGKIVKYFNGVPAEIGKQLKPLSELKNQAAKWGSDMLKGFVDGIKNNMKYLSNSAKDMAASVKKYLHFSRPDEGPLREYEEWMPDFIEGMASGVEKNKYKLVDKIKAMASDIKLASSVKLSSAMLGGYGSIDSSGSENRQLVIQFYGTQIRNDNDIDKISRSIYNENQKVIRGMGKRGK